MSIIPYIIKDLKQPVDYIPAGIALSLLLCAALNLCFFVYGRCVRQMKAPLSKVFLKNVLLFILVLYGFIFLKQAFFSRPPGSRTSLNLTFLGTWGESPQSRAYVIENVLMFIPYGFLLPALIPVFRRIWFCTLTAACVSVLLEFTQYVTSRGHCQLDDVVMNTLGALIGCCILRFFLFGAIPKLHK